MLYDTTRRAPKAGSMLEALFLLIRAKRDSIELSKTFLLVQAMIDDEKAEATAKALERYRKSLLPYLEDEEKKDVAAIRKALDDEVKRGPMRVRPTMPSNTIRSRLKAVVSRIRNEANLVKAGK